LSGSHTQASGFAGGQVTLPLPILVAVLLSALYKIPDFPLGDVGFGPVRSHFQMGQLNEALDNHSKAVKTYEQYILSEARNFSSNLTFSERVQIIKATPTLIDREIHFSKKVSIFKTLF
jgi:hypothetical protein